MIGLSKPQPPYGRRALIALAVLVALCGVSVAVWVVSSGDDALAEKRSSSSSVAVEAEEGGTGPQNTRSLIRPETGPRATHGSHQLRDFYLPPLDFEGRSLVEALDLVRAAYEKTCRDSGEQPLQVVFKLPPGYNPVLRVKTRYRTLESTVHLLAGVAKLGVSRHGREYRFALPEKGDGRMAHKEFDFPAGIGGTHYLTEIGVVFEPTTRVSNRPGGVTVESANPGDLAAFESISRSLAMDPRVSLALTARIVKLPAGYEWKHADQSGMSPAEFESLMRECANREGVELLTLPSIMMRSEEDATIEMVRDMRVKSDDPAGGFETYPVGIVVNANLHPLGLGHQTNAHLSITEGDVNPRTGRPVIDQQADLAVDSFSADAGTVMKVQSHPDGSRTVLMLSPVLIDATGHPARALE